MTTTSSLRTQRLKTPHSRSCLSAVEKLESLLRPSLTYVVRVHHLRKAPLLYVYLSVFCLIHSFIHSSILLLPISYFLSFSTSLLATILVCLMCIFDKYFHAYPLKDLCKNVGVGAGLLGCRTFVYLI